MIVVLGISIALRILAVIWSVYLFRRIRDWRIGFLTLMFSLMTLRQSLTLWNTPASDFNNFQLAATELPGLIVSILAFLSIFFLEQLLAAPEKAEKDLRENENRFQQMAENLEDILWESSVDGQEFFYVSPAYETIFQRKVVDLYQNPTSWIGFLLPEDRPKVIEVFNREGLIRGLFNIEYRITRPDNSIRWIHAKGVPIKNESGEVYRIAGIASDITQKKLTEIALQASKAELEKRVEERTTELIKINGTLRKEMQKRQQSIQALEESEERFRALFTQATEALFLYDDEGRFIDVNPKACESLGYTREELLNMALPDIEMQFDPQILEDRWEKMEAGETFSVEGIQRRKNGTTFPTEVFTGHIEWGHKTYVLASVRDITQRKEAEAEILKAQQEAEKASHAKSEFLSHMSHELRTPLNSILGFTQLLKLNKRGNMGPKEMDGVEQILTAGNHLLELIDEILDLTRIETGTATIFKENTDVVRLVKKVISVVEPLANQKNIKITDYISENDSLYVFADPYRLKQALINVATNAIKYNSDGGEVILDSEPAKGNRIKIYIIDTGPGIEPEKQKTIFEPFERLAAKNMKIEGAGIGLTLTKKLMDLMGGSISVDTEMGKGSRFTLELPAGFRGENAATTHPEGITTFPNTTKGKQYQQTVLYIGDNDSNLTQVEKCLMEYTSYQFIPSTNAKDGLELARTYRPSLILMHINLPGMDGITAFKKLQTWKETKDIPVIAVGVNAMEHEIKNGLNAGFKSYLTKPIDLSLLVETIHKTLNASSS